MTTGRRCEQDGCESRIQARGLCGAHYMKVWRAERRAHCTWWGYDVDDMAVQRFVDGDPPSRFGVWERRQAVAILTRQGMSARQIAVRVGVSSRQVVRDRSRVGVAA